MRHYKYIHFLWHDELKFNTRLVRMINNKEYGFSLDDHLFVTPHKMIYEALRNYRNVILFDSKKQTYTQVINLYASFGDWLFFHSILSWGSIFKVKKKYYKKIIWRTWGHDATFAKVNEGSLLKRLKNRIFNFFKLRVVRLFFAVGVSSNYIDALDIKMRYGNVKTVHVSYPEKTKDIIVSNSQKKDILNIMVGHSGYPADNHIEVMEKLKKYKNENICIYLIFSYANTSYMKEIVDYVNTNWSQKVVVVTKFMPLNEYKEFCSRMDIGIFDFDKPQSYAIGNVSLLFSLRKKLFFNRKGLWHKAFSEKGAPHCCTDELDNMSFEQFRSPLIFEEEKYEGLDKKTFEENLESWKLLLKKLDYITREGWGLSQK